jgi:AcrR family transcriptional regulator
MNNTLAAQRGFARRAEILGAARQCFIQNGLHTTSMQDLLKAANVSVGVFYHYFASKDAIIAAVADEVLAEISAPHAGPSAPPLKSVADFVRRVIVSIEDIDKKSGSATLAVQLWSEALRNPAMGKVAAESLNKVIDWFTDKVTELQKTGAIPKGQSASGIAAILLGMVHGFMVQRALLKLDARTYCRGLKRLSL